MLYFNHGYTRDIISVGCTLLARLAAIAFLAVAYWLLQ